jgi:hypothetical protein
VVDEFQAKTHHRDTENTEVAQRNQYVATFCAKPHRGQHNLTEIRLAIRKVMRIPQNMAATLTILVRSSRTFNHLIAINKGLLTLHQ